MNTLWELLEGRELVGHDATAQLLVTYFQTENLLQVWHWYDHLPGVELGSSNQLTAEPVSYNDLQRQGEAFLKDYLSNTGRSHQASPCPTGCDHRSPQCKLSCYDDNERRELTPVDRYHPELGYKS